MENNGLVRKKINFCMVLASIAIIAGIMMYVSKITNFNGALFVLVTTIIILIDATPFSIRMIFHRLFCEQRSRSNPVFCIAFQNPADQNRGRFLQKVARILHNPLRHDSIPNIFFFLNYIEYELANVVGNIRLSSERDLRRDAKFLLDNEKGVA